LSHKNEKTLQAKKLTRQKKIEAIKKSIKEANVGRLKKRREKRRRRKRM
jgi:hypothetical protein